MERQTEQIEAHIIERLVNLAIDKVPGNRDSDQDEVYNAAERAVENHLMDIDVVSMCLLCRQHADAIYGAVLDEERGAIIAAMMTPEVDIRDFIAGGAYESERTRQYISRMFLGDACEAVVKEVLERDAPDVMHDRDSPEKEWGDMNVAVFSGLMEKHS